MGNLWKSAKRWMKSTSNRTFVMWPLLLFALHPILYSGTQALNGWALPLLIWGYAQYRLVGIYRSRAGGGGPGMSVPPERLVSSGPYTLSRNPMYLGHIIFFFGLALMFGGAAWVVFAGHAIWFDQRARDDERNLIDLFDGPYRDYMHRVKRWVPGIY